MRVAPGSFGARNGAAWSRAYADDRKRHEAQLGDTAAGQALSLLPTSQAALLRAIEAQVCPWCGSGPYKVLSQHTHAGHGISAAELRKLAGLNTDASICSQSAADSARERLVGRVDRAEITTRGAARAAEVGAQRAAVQAFRSKRLAQNSGKHAEILRRFREDPTTDLAEIAAAVGMHPRSVKVILRRAGEVVGDRRSVAGQRHRADRHRQLVDGSQRARRELVRSRLARFGELGADWSAVERCAEEWGVSGKTARAFLRKHGVAVPDGRRVVSNSSRTKGMTTDEPTR